MIGKSWSRFRASLSGYGKGTVFVAGGLAGILFWGGFNTFMEYTNTLGFCISCHEMRDPPYEEYRESLHYRNASGVRVICSDCHVPRDWTAKLLRKIEATRELFYSLAGTLDTPEKFEARRLEMARRVWASMEASDSRECRNCHSFEAMDFDRQGRRPRQKHPRAFEKGETCIECHKGVAHELPDGGGEDG